MLIFVYGSLSLFLFVLFICSVGKEKKKKKEKMGFVLVFFKKKNECQRWVWKEPMIGDKSLSCGAVVTTERHLDVCVTPRPRTLSHKLCCTSSSSYRVVLQENVCHQPLNMCLNDISPVCVRERLSPRETSNVVFFLRVDG